MNKEELGKSDFELEEGGARDIASKPFKTGLADWGRILRFEMQLKLRFRRLRWAAFGDSITAGSWVKQVAEKRRLNCLNLALGGSRVVGYDGHPTAMCEYARISQLAYDFDLITIMGGTNDWSQNVPLDTGPSSNGLSFRTCYQRMLDRIQSQVPAARIVVLTMPYAEQANWQARPGFSDRLTNRLGLRLSDYCEIVRSVARGRNLPLIDLEERLAWDETSMKTCFDPPDGIHPNGFGNVQIADEVDKALQAHLVLGGSAA